MGFLFTPIQPIIMKRSIILLLLIGLIGFCCSKPSESKFIELRGGVRFTPESNCLYHDSTIIRLKAIIKAGYPFDSILAETKKIIANDTVLLARDSLKANVRVVVTSPVAGFGARVNGLEVETQQKQIAIFPDSICFWINAYGTQGTLAGSLFINGKKKDFEFKDYEPMTNVTTKFSLKDFKELLPRKPKPIVPLLQKDSLIVRSNAKQK